MLVQKSHDKPAFADLSNNELIGKILNALQAVDVCLEHRPCSPDSEGNTRIDCLTLFIRAIGWHRSGNIWIATDTEAGRTVLVEAIDEWLPNLLDRLIYSQKTYPVIVHGIPTSFNTSWDSKDILEHLRHLQRRVAH